MTRTLAALVLLLAIVTPAPAVFLRGGLTIPGPPPTCSNKFDFSQACNSQYLG